MVLHTRIVRILYSVLSLQTVIKNSSVNQIESFFVSSKFLEEVFKCTGLQPAGRMLCVTNIPYKTVYLHRNSSGRKKNCSLGMLREKTREWSFSCLCQMNNNVSFFSFFFFARHVSEYFLLIHTVTNASIVSDKTKRNLV